MCAAANRIVSYRYSIESHRIESHKIKSKRVRKAGKSPRKVRQQPLKQAHRIISAESRGSETETEAQAQAEAIFLMPQREAGGKKEIKLQNSNTHTHTHIHKAHTSNQEHIDTLTLVSTEGLTHAALKLTQTIDHII